MMYEVGMKLWVRSERAYYTIVGKTNRFWHLLPESGIMEDGLMKTTEELDEDCEVR